MYSFWDDKLHPSDATYYAMENYIAACMSEGDGVCHKINYDSQGGHTMIKTSLVVEGQRIGLMPLVVKHGYRFEGWYTQLEEGELITEDTVYEFDGDMTLYAHFSRR